MHIYIKYKHTKNEDKVRSSDVYGMLLYARTTETIKPRLPVSIGGNQIDVQTLELNRPFANISSMTDYTVYECFGESVQGLV